MALYKTTMLYKPLREIDSFALFTDVHVFRLLITDSLLQTTTMCFTKTELNKE